MAASVRHALLDSNLEKQNASSVQAMSISKVTHVSRVAMSAKDAIVGLTNALNARPNPNYRLDNVSVKTASIKIQTMFASRVAAPVQHVTTLQNARLAQLGSNLEKQNACFVRAMNIFKETLALTAVQTVPDVTRDLISAQAVKIAPLVSTTDSVLAL